MGPGSRYTRALHSVAKGCPPELAADLVVSTTLVFVKYSQDIVKHNKGNGAIFSFNDKVPVSKPSPDDELQSRALTMKLQSRALITTLQCRNMRITPISVI